jgi:hypothetical protein
MRLLIRLRRHPHVRLDSAVTSKPYATAAAGAAATAASCPLALLASDRFLLQVLHAAIRLLI